VVNACGPSAATQIGACVSCTVYCCLLLGGCASKELRKLYNSLCGTLVESRFCCVYACMRALVTIPSPCVYVVMLFASQVHNKKSDTVNAVDIVVRCA